MNLQYGLTGYNVNEANLSNKIMESSKEVIVVADNSKVFISYLTKIF